MNQTIYNMGFVIYFSSSVVGLSVGSNCNHFENELEMKSNSSSYFVNLLYLINSSSLRQLGKDVTYMKAAKANGFLKCSLFLPEQ